MMLETGELERGPGVQLVAASRCQRDVAVCVSDSGHVRNAFYWKISQSRIVPAF